MQNDLVKLDAPLVGVCDAGALCSTCDLQKQCSSAHHQGCWWLHTDSGYFQCGLAGFLQKVKEDPTFFKVFLIFCCFK